MASSNASSNYAWVWAVICVFLVAAVWMYIDREETTGDTGTDVEDVASATRPDPTVIVDPVITTPDNPTLAPDPGSSSLGSLVDETIGRTADDPPATDPSLTITPDPLPAPDPLPVPVVNSDPLVTSNPADPIVFDPTPDPVVTPDPIVTTPTASTYTIQEGDTFSTIARDKYGDEKKWIAIRNANPDVDPTRLKIGQEIKLPDLSTHQKQRDATITEARGAAETGGTSTITVEPGDVLSTIAKRVYGKSSLWTVIYEANRDKLESPDDLNVGMKLTIPPKPGDDTVVPSPSDVQPLGDLKVDSSDDTIK